MNNMTPTKQQRAWVNEVLKELQHILYATEWHFNISYASEDEEHDHERFASSITAKIVVQSPYLQAFITIFPEFWENEHEDRVRILVHEMCHIHTQGMRDIWHRLINGHVVTQEEMNDVNERCTSFMERFVFKGSEKRLMNIKG